MHRRLIAAALLTFTAPALAQSADAPSMPGVKLNVADMARTTAFYTALGMKPGPKYNAHEAALEWDGPAQGSRIIMVHDETGRLSFPSGGAFLMISAPDMKAALDRLKAAGFANLGEPRSNPRFTVLMLKDPDGNQIELLSAGVPAPAK